MVAPVRWRVAAAGAAALLSSVVQGQTWSACNPLYTTTCPANPALGIAINVDFAQGGVNSFAASGGAVSYGSDGASFTVAKTGDAPQLTSVFYIMFGRVEVTMRSAPGAGIVSSLVLQSDVLDEIDMEWLGVDSAQVQTNYFGKGQTTTYNRGQFNPAPDNQNKWTTYTIDWTSERIVWFVDGTAVRTLTFSEANGQYPQTPMQVKFGAWAGGDPSNNELGTVQWAQGPTDYSKGPFSMLVKSAIVTDYSTGKSYKYGDSTGSWQSIQAEGGSINGNLDKAGKVIITATAPAATNSAPAIPTGGLGKGGSGGSSSADTPQNPIPDGWVMTPKGKIVPIGSGVMNAPHPFLLVSTLFFATVAAFLGRWP